MKLDQTYNGCKRIRIKGQSREDGPIVEFPYDSCTFKQQLYASTSNNEGISTSDKLIASRSSIIVSAESDLPWYFGSQKVKMAQMQYSDAVIEFIRADIDFDKWNAPSKRFSR
jgi:hypothetical protein